MVMSLFINTAQARVVVTRGGFDASNGSRNTQLCGGDTLQIFQRKTLTYATVSPNWSLLGVLSPNVRKSRSNFGF